VFTGPWSTTGESAAVSVCDRPASTALSFSSVNDIAASLAAEPGLMVEGSVYWMDSTAAATLD
jgi:hypothetical protein